MARKVTEKQMEKLARRDAGRRTARGIGAVFGTITSLLVSWILLGKMIKDSDEE